MVFDLKAIKKAVEQVSEEKGIDSAKVIEAIEGSIAAAYKKEYEKKGELIKAKFDIKTGELKFWQAKIVVDESTVRMPDPEEEAGELDQVAHSSENSEKLIDDGEEKLPRYNPSRHILIEEAVNENSDIAIGEEILYPLESTEEFGRIAAQAAKQVILQRLREAERDSVLGEFKNKEGEIISGLVQRIERGNVYIDLGRATGIMFSNEAIPGEHYKIGERLKFYIVKVADDTRMASIILSRSHPQFVSRLFELEIPEITDKTIEIKGVAREAGSRTKIAVVSNMEGVDPVGSCVGQRGTRVMAVSNELGQEKIDIIEWSEDPARFIASSLSPATVNEVEILPDNEARIFVDNDQLSLAIGRGGQNVRLAARLTGWKIDVRSNEEPEEELVEEDEESTDLPEEEKVVEESTDSKETVVEEEKLEE
ncbi:MAG: transcription termination/antitermination protein NusA [Candidatus Harrisonbacteria bacterium CG10_big_fil_rev_8_21_14_0_10_38_8]|uniref:Transcription termination/antitermination protein NusA n=1 Tax=Candidatus Harrisonbacteria bacterium CG10_big_fil_rev_8_21_14_0_10_38_8 TaxID=1974582 RepID=A0A2M6WJH6_9BACT|nr:MAG: transcription termination/antitermination protein NusA [Candidatus Harrisonbacteria bacterium CG10_big_fil_rev_8_21_14_0_10_38_8]